MMVNGFLQNKISDIAHKELIQKPAFVFLIIFGNYSYCYLSDKYYAHYINEIVDNVDINLLSIKLLYLQTQFYL